MEPFFVVMFGLMAVGAASLEWLNRHGRAGKSTDQGFLRFKNNYLLVYSLMMAGDWLQGPYVYALYQHYGFSRGDIGRLFIAGFGSSMVFGTVVGALADRHGRKRAALLYAATYALGCATKHVNRFDVLFVGRLFCGVATSLLYSAFESWVVGEHFRRGYAPDALGTVFSQAVFLGNGVMAIAAGLLAHFLVEGAALGPVAPFDAAALVLVVGGAVVAATWVENYGDTSADSAGGAGSTGGAVRAALALVAGEPKIALLGAMQSLFEGSMYTFVFLWTPALSPAGERIPHGMIFACFMVSSMLGSAIAGRLLGDSSAVRVERYMQTVFIAAALCLAVPVYCHSIPGITTATADGSFSFLGRVQMVAFCCFELLVGMFWPSMMTMRSNHVPEEIRSTVINIFRIPLNLFVCIVLYNVEAFSLSRMFSMCAAFLLICAFCQRRFAAIIHHEKTGIGRDAVADVGEIALTA